MRRLAPGVDATVFRPGLGVERRAALGLAERPVVVCVSRLMPRKGQDVLLRAWPQVKASVSGAALLLVGGGPSRRQLECDVDAAGLRDDVVLTGSVPTDALPSYYGAGDVFAMPCRTRLGGLDVEGLGIVYLEAAACGLPVVAGSSGGAPDAVLDGETGFVVDGESVSDVRDRIVQLLTDQSLARTLGDRGRAWVSDQWSWQRSADDFQMMLRR
jgi:phosphatidylinositol alpha-1,6-mannosyltransferase